MRMQLFKNYVKEWQREFGLFDWRITAGKDDFDEDSGAARMMLSNFEGRIASILINKDWDQPPTKAMIELVAFHEVCEVLVEELRTMVRAKEFTESQLNSAVHTLIRRLEHVCLGSS